MDNLQNIHWQTSPVRRTSVPTARLALKKNVTGSKSFALMINRPAIELLLGTKSEVNLVLGYMDKAVFFKVCDEPEPGSYRLKMPKSKASHTTFTASWFGTKLADKINHVVKIEVVTREIFQADFSK